MPLTYAILIMQYNKRDIDEIIKVIPISGMTMIIICLLAKYVPFIPNYFYLSNGRMIGFFQYSNTYALFLLIGIISFIESNISKAKKYIGIAILLIGIYWSGSRTVFVLTIFNFIILIIKNRNLRKYLLALIGLSIIGTIAYTLITKDFDTFGRYLTITTNSDTLVERLLYYKDALLEILKNPFGLGYMGYSYIQPSIQTGVYHAEYVHNDLIQIILDIGIIPMIIFVVAIINTLFAKGIKKFDTKKQILLTIILHIIFDFDLQFTYIFLIIVMTLNIFSGKLYVMKSKNNIVIPTISLITIIYLYFGICTLFQYINKSELAIKMYPIYTEANLNVMNDKVEYDIEYANKVASKILETNENSKSVYDVKALYYMEQGSWRLMVKNKQKSIEIGKYDIENYEEYVFMLSGAIDYYANSNDLKETEKYMKLVIEVPSKLENIKDETSSLAYRLKDKPNFELSENIQNYIEKIKGVYDND